ncbi:MAG: hypothetical protein ACYTGU_19020 [Planctomycetota bacterium]
MNKIGFGLVLLALAFGFGIPALAGGNGAVPTGLFLAHYDNNSPPSVITEPRVRVGNVVFNPTADGKMSVQITLRKGEPGETFGVITLPRGIWGNTERTMATDKHGHASLRYQVDIPDGIGDSVRIKVAVRTGFATTDFAYATESEEVSLKKVK